MNTSGRATGTRNVNEKKRRDQQKLLIHEIASLIPEINKDLDKAGILKSAVNYLKCHNDVVLGDVEEQESLLSGDEIGRIMVQVFNGFIIVLDRNLRICYVSKEITALFPLHSAVFVGRPLSDFIHPDDCRSVYFQLESAASTDVMPLSNLPVVKFRFLVDGKHGSLTQQCVNCIAYRRSMLDAASYDEDQLSAGHSDMLVLLVCVEKEDNVFILPSDNCLMKIFSRHSMDGTFISIDPSSTFLTGFLPSELIGTSWYDRVHINDLQNFSQAHKQLAQICCGKGVTVRIRFLTKGNDWLTLDGTLMIASDAMATESKCIQAEFTAVTSPSELTLAQRPVSRRRSSERNHTTPQGTQPDSRMNDSANQGHVQAILEQSSNGEQLFHPFLNPQVSASDGKHCTAAINVIAVEQATVARDLNVQPSSPSSQPSNVAQTVDDQQCLHEAEKNMQQQLTAKLGKVEVALCRQRLQIDAMRRKLSKLSMAPSANGSSSTSAKNEENQLLDYFVSAWKQQETEHKRLVAELSQNVKNLTIQERMQKLRENAKQKKQNIEAARVANQREQQSRQSTSTASVSRMSHVALAPSNGEGSSAPPGRPTDGHCRRPTQKRKFSTEGSNESQTASPSPVDLLGRSTSQSCGDISTFGCSSVADTNYLRGAVQAQEDNVGCGSNPVNITQLLKQRLLQKQHQGEVLGIQQQQQHLGLLEQLRIQQALMQHQQEEQQQQQQQQEQQLLQQEELEKQLSAFMVHNQLPVAPQSFSKHDTGNSTQLMLLMTSLQRQLQSQMQTNPGLQSSELGQLVPALQQLQQLLSQQQESHGTSDIPVLEQQQEPMQCSSRSGNRMACPPTPVIDLSPSITTAAFLGSPSNATSVAVASHLGYDGTGLVAQPSFPSNVNPQCSEQQSLREGKMPAPGGNVLPRHEQKAKNIEEEDNGFEGDFMTSFQHQLILLQKEQRLAFIRQQQCELSYFDNRAQVLPDQQPASSVPVYQVQTSGPSTSSSTPAAMSPFNQQQPNQELRLNETPSDGFQSGLGFSFTDLLGGDIPGLSEEDEAVVDLLLANDF